MKFMPKNPKFKTTKIKKSSIIFYVHFIYYLSGQQQGQPIGPRQVLHSVRLSSVQRHDLREIRAHHPLKLQPGQLEGLEEGVVGLLQLRIELHRPQLVQQMEHLRHRKIRCGFRRTASQQLLFVENGGVIFSLKVEKSQVA